MNQTRLRPRPERGAAVADFAMVAPLLLVVFLATLQVAFTLHVRNTLISCAAEGARYGARAGSTPAQGVARTKELIAAELATTYARSVSGQVDVTGAGVRVVSVRVRAPLPVLGSLGPDGVLDVVGRAFLEQQ